ncbi:F-box protein At2g26850-like [Silene latifolia]|uniref:F-box protein At2g26850-like n=1 Tax=Silene latifolia TaxID=37657 RepID=UPI003D77AEBD
MLLFLLSCFSFIIVFKSSNLYEMVSFLTPKFWIQLFLRPVLKNHASFELSKLDDFEMSLLDLHDLALDQILEQLSPAELCSLAGVCTYLRSKCRSNDMWEKHMEKKWGRIIGNAALREWHWYMANNNKRKYSISGGNNGGSFYSICSWWPLNLVFRPKLQRKSEIKGDLPPDSIMAWYLSLETGEFWFPAQVYNRENGHDGFMLSCYDAKISYNLKTDTFQARYSPHGRRTIEENISWSRLRTPPIDTPPYNLHISDCLDDLRPGDHFEIQWRRNKAYPYGWWYGVIGHLESCSVNEDHCICHDSETVIMEFNQYAPESRWRRKKVSRKDHREEGNEADGFYGGIRKLYSKQEISMWKSLWPTKVLN